MKIKLQMNFLSQLILRIMMGKKNDGFFITNYRADRVRELLTAIFDENFNEFKREKVANFLNP